MPRHAPQSEHFDAGVRHWLLQLQTLFGEACAVQALHAIETAANLEVQCRGGVQAGVPPAALPPPACVVRVVCCAAAAARLTQAWLPALGCASSALLAAKSSAAAALWNHLCTHQPPDPPPLLKWLLTCPRPLPPPSA